MRRTLNGTVWLPAAWIALTVALSACDAGGSGASTALQPAEAKTEAPSGSAQPGSDHQSVTHPGMSPAQGIAGGPDRPAAGASQPDASEPKPAAPSAATHSGANAEAGGSALSGSSAAPASSAQASSGSPAASPQAASGAALAETAQPPAPASAGAPPQAAASPPGIASASNAAAPEAAAANPADAPTPQAPQNPPAASAPAARQETQATSISIRIVGDKEKGTILDTVQVELREGDTALDVLKRIAKEKKIQLETRGSGKSSYIEGIANLYEFDKGAKSGWLYRVNGKFPNVSAGAYALSKGDRIDWLYTLNLGKDVGKEADS
ncbi:hypothetical protein PAESOLCIP111_04784 [Paenibacillus solanacearum]|uniref:Transcobalamin-like C-terminal domain-containing protein n=1 Tax=Paenibacillus solanacearum TaxID=2048548 RepID=A0A916K6J2_9BACL|nr:DUF4430 domain-containing protein [Paenibacillus solanacearum]CAG7644724.1 hypothetical protein PAESOLCIP111_04784 [Paenibacillus solanacearum]